MVSSEEELGRREIGEERKVGDELGRGVPCPRPERC